MNVCKDIWETNIFGIQHIRVAAVIAKFFSESPCLNHMLPVVFVTPQPLRPLLGRNLVDPFVAG